MTTTKKGIDWRLFGIIAAGCLVGALGLLPYITTMLQQHADSLKMPLPALALLSLIQPMVLCLLAAMLGLYLGPATGLDMPYLRRWLGGPQPPRRTATMVWQSVVAGLAAGGLMLLLIRVTHYESLMSNPEHPVAQPRWWAGLLASFYGGINEEIMLRLGLMTLFAWIAGRIRSTNAGHTTPAGMWVAILLAALLFGAGHLPAAMGITTLTPLLAVLIVFLNSVGGVIFGWLFWKRGLEAAIIAHFCADIVLHVL